MKADKANIIEVDGSADLVASVAVVASFLGITERRVQQLEACGRRGGATISGRFVMLIASTCVMALSTQMRRRPRQTSALG